LKNLSLSRTRLGVVTLVWLVLILALFLIMLAHNEFYRPDNVFKRFQHAFYSLQKEGHKNLQVLTQLPQRENYYNQELGADLSRSLAKSHAKAFIYLNDSLVFWSDNSVDPGVNVLKIIKKDTVISLSNGLYLAQLQRENDRTFAVFTLIYASFPFQNNYLRNGFSPVFPSGVKRAVAGDQPTYPVVFTDDDIKPLFSLAINEDPQIGGVLYGILVLLLIAILLSFYSLFYLGFLFVKPRIGKHLGFIGLVAMVGLCRVTQIYAQWPGDIYHGEFFSASYFSAGPYQPGFGDLFLNAISLLFLAFIFFKEYRFTKDTVPEKTSVGYFSLATILLIVAAFVYIYQIELIITNSSIPLSFKELYNFNLLSYISFFVIAAISSSYILISRILLQKLFHLFPGKRWGITLILLILGVYYLVISFGSTQPGIHHFWFPAVLFLLVIGEVFRGRQIAATSAFFFFIIFLSFLLAFVFYKKNREVADKNQLLIAYKIADESDPLLEFLLAETLQQIEHDETLQKMVASLTDDFEDNEKMLLDYVEKHYLNGYYNKYNANLIVCKPKEVLHIKPDDYLIDCNTYFEDLLSRSGKSTSTRNLFLISDYVQQTYYLAKVDVANNDQNNQAEKDVLYLELYNRYLPEGIGYPELLIDDMIDQSKSISSYSFARYMDNRLVYKFGSYLYPYHLDSTSPKRLTYSDKDQYRHLYFPVNEKLSITVSRKTKSTIDIIAPFSYFFLFIGFILALVLLLVYYKDFQSRAKHNFRTRLQALVILSLVMSYLVISIISFNYTQAFYQQKNKDFLREKTQSILIELEHKLNGSDFRDEGIQAYISQLLEKFSDVFFSDINLYDLNGRLLASSRQEIFDKGLISKMMNQEAYEKLKHHEALYFIHNEQIGAGEYLSSYIPFRNTNGDPVAFLNLPYFAKESELREEISSFLLTFLNIVFMLTGFSVWMALLLSRRMTQPLIMIQQKMRNIGLNKTNEKIAYQKPDEIGQLVKQYNQLIDELEISAGLLARSERESAWREMARQVAHEIKNPLTPMRLSIQYLQKAWDENDPDLELKIKKTTQTVIEQIDALSAIATAFSDFAAMPESKPEFVSLQEIIQQVINLFDQDHAISIVFEDHTSEAALVYVDRKNLIRVFNNLIKNAIQAIEYKKSGMITITISDAADHYKVTVADNGKGMSAEESQRIFTPYFTTKSSGTGIGLSIVHNIIQVIGGQISFVTEPGKGTTFTLFFPGRNLSGEKHTSKHS